MKKEDEVVVSLCEQGDLGLFGDPLNEKDQKRYKEQEEKKRSTPGFKRIEEEQ